MTILSVARARRPECVGGEVTVQGWVRTRRDSKGGFSFLEINDGSCFGNLQVVADGKLANYEAEIKKIPTGASVRITGEVKASPHESRWPGPWRATVEVVGGADPETFPLQK